MHIEKRKEAAFLIYCIILIILAISNIAYKFDIVHLVYLVVVLSCVLKFVLIVHKNEK